MTAISIAADRSRFSRRTACGILIALLVGLNGCATKDAVFVTKTSLSILDLDATPAGISFAHDRTEAYFGPRFGNGDVYPVTGYFRGSGAGAAREVQQVFAGGEAATIVLGATPSTPQTSTTSSTTSKTCKDKRDSPPLAFATATTLGIKLGFQENTILPTSFVFGYRRKEAAWVPVSVDCKPSVLAALDSSATAKAKDGDSKLNAGVTQFFATGAAANKLAENSAIRGNFEREAIKAVGEVEAFTDRRASQNQLTLQIFDCAARVPDMKFDEVVSNADELDILPIIKLDAAEIRRATNTKDRLAVYARKLHLLNGKDDVRTTALGLHKTRVCNLASAG